MSHSLTIAASVTPGNQTALSLSKIYSVDILDITYYTAVAGASDAEVEICGASTLADVKFVLISADSYPETVPGTPDLEYKVNADSELAIPMQMFHMWNEHMLVGLDVAGLLPDSIFVSNDSADDVEMTIVVGRMNV
jgi:hypothetical protein